MISILKKIRNFCYRIYLQRNFLSYVNNIYISNTEHYKENSFVFYLTSLLIFVLYFTLKAINNSQSIYHIKHL